MGNKQNNVSNAQGASDTGEGKSQESKTNNHLHDDVLERQFDLHQISIGAETGIYPMLDVNY